MSEPDAPSDEQRTLDDDDDPWAPEPTEVVDPFSPGFFFGDRFRIDAPLGTGARDMFGNGGVRGGVDHRAAIGGQVPRIAQFQRVHGAFALNRCCICATASLQGFHR